MVATIMSTITMLEHLAFNAWPALQAAVQDDWLLRFADGYSKRANSVNALCTAPPAPTAALERRIADAEALFARRHIRCVFRFTPLMDPQVDVLLKARGWRRLDETIVMVSDLAHGLPTPPGVSVASTRDEAWSRGYMHFNSVAPERQAIHDLMLANIVPEAGFAASFDDARQPAAFGLGVVERGHVGLFDIVSDPLRRRAGHGRRVVQGLMDWGRTRGAARAYLQVVATNTRAIALYESLGFREIYRHYYRAGPL